MDLNALIQFFDLFAKSQAPWMLLAVVLVSAGIVFGTQLIKELRSQTKAMDRMAAHSEAHTLKLEDLPRQIAFQLWKNGFKQSGERS